MSRYLFLLFFSIFLNAQTTGKISGSIYDMDTNEPIIGANVIILDTGIGTASDVDGSYYIINLSPGLYNLKVDYIGYETKILKDINVSVNRTSQHNISIQQSAIEGAIVEVTVDAVSIKKDQTSTVKNVSSDQIEILPVEDIGSIISMQAGVVAGSFRGGRSTEVTYLVDGMKVDEGFGGEGQAVTVEPETVSEIEVITGTFNAEYGKAMSGVVNQITKSGSNNFEISLNAGYANYFSSNSNIFIGIDEFSLNRNLDSRFQISGPILKNKLFFLVNYRTLDNRNHLNGINYFEVDDSSNYSSDNSNDWFSEHSGDSSFVPMNKSLNQSVMSKLLFKYSDKLKTSFLYTSNSDEWHPYNHAFKFNVNGMAFSSRSSSLYAFQTNYMLNNSIFMDLKYSFMEYSSGYYVYENPLDSRYVSGQYFQSAPGFFTGGQEKSHSSRVTQDNNIKFDLTWQINKNHNFKTGIDFINHNIKNHFYTILEDPDEEVYTPFIFQDTTLTTFNDIFDVSPSELSFYMQDKMEFDAMVINFGIRYDRFNPNTLYPSEYRNPLNLINAADTSIYLDAKTQNQISPRLGLAYQVADEAVLHFSYGHFFQMPPFYAMYNRSDWLVPLGDFQTIMGNPNLSAEKTIKYEIGIWQRLNRYTGLDINLYYKDIYNLLGTRTITTFNNVKYGLYSNKDYGNVRGVELKLDFLYDNLTAFVNYTLQFTRGIADNPAYAFTREGNGQDPINRLIPMSWDQRHTFNISIGYNKKEYGVTSTCYYNSGTTYSFSPIGESNISSLNLLPNNSYKPSNISVDLRSYLTVLSTKNFSARITLSIYNLFDRLNEYSVYSDTGRAYTTIITDSQRNTYRSTFSTIDDVYKNPSMYSSPRQIKFTFGVTFK